MNCAVQAEVRAARAELAAHRSVVDKCEKLTKEVSDQWLYFLNASTPV
jgi:hypothetical protein